MAIKEQIGRVPSLADLATPSDSDEWSAIPLIDDEEPAPKAVVVEKKAVPAAGAHAVTEAHAVQVGQKRIKKWLSHSLPARP